MLCVRVCVGCPCVSQAMRTGHISVLRFLKERYPSLAVQTSPGTARPAFQPLWGTAQPAFQVAPFDVGSDDDAEDENVDVSTMRERQVIDQMVERLLHGEVDEAAPAPTRKQMQRAQMHSGFKTAPSDSSNPECKQS